VILSNDCEDGSDEMLYHLSKSGEIITCAISWNQSIQLNFSGDAVFARDCSPDIGRPCNRVL